MISKLLQCSLSVLSGLGLKDVFSFKISPQATRYPRANFWSGLTYLYKDLTEEIKQRVMDREINKFAHR
jgi:hypothetical protein